MGVSLELSGMFETLEIGGKSRDTGLLTALLTAPLTVSYILTRV